MPRITVLPPDLRNKIAAGEVIERPASVVKELIENSLDAGSTEIKVEVRDGGRRSIVVADNGIGMDREDARLAFSRHATSKIQTFDDLYHLSTLGFRGEALPSIASISRLRITTVAEGADSGISLEIEGGKVIETRESAGQGTAIEVRDLFFNTPARRKFLKATQTELFHVIDIVTRTSLCHPQTAFILVVDGKETMRLPRAAGLRERIQQVFGPEFLDGLIGVSAVRDVMTIEAYVSRPGMDRGTRSHQYLFINSRPVKDAAISRAVCQSLEGSIAKERHPVFFLSLSLPPERIDFNVHPTKREVRFADKDLVFRFVFESLRNRLAELRGESSREFLSPAGQPAPQVPTYERYSGSGWQPLAAPALEVSENLAFAYRPALPFIPLGESFLAVSGKGGVLLIDHHAAHERVLFEKLMKGMKTATLRLLFPKQVRLGAREYHALLGRRDALEELGIELDDFGGSTVIVRSVPEELKDADLPAILSDIAAAGAEGGVDAAALKKEMASRIACHSSIRGSRMLSQEELGRLLDDLEKTDHPDHCPHGRPTRIFYSLDDLRRLFKRL